MKKLKFDLHTGVAFLIWAAILTVAYYLKPDSANYNTLCMWMTIGVSGYTTKRLFQKKPEFNSLK